MKGTSEKLRRSCRHNEASYPTTPSRVLVQDSARQRPESVSATPHHTPPPREVWPPLPPPSPSPLRVPRPATRPAGGITSVRPELRAAGPAASPCAPAVVYQCPAWASRGRTPWTRYAPPPSRSSRRMSATGTKWASAKAGPQALHPSLANIYFLQLVCEYRRL